jgi:hypothetical protein
VKVVRGQIGEPAGIAAVSNDDETGPEPLPMAIGRAERRLQVRAYSLWAGMLGDRQFPPVTALDPVKLADLALHGVLLDFSQSTDDPAICHIGSALAQECGPAGSIGKLSEAPAGSLLAHITDHYHEVLARRAPVGFEAEFANWRGTTTLYRGILLPFSSDDATIDHVFGVINWKELADTGIADELAHQIEGAIEPLRRLHLEPTRPDGSSADGWLADGWLEEAAPFPPGIDEDLAERLRQRDGRSWPATLAAEGGEFALVLTRRLPSGEIALLGEIPEDARLLERAARRLLG